MDIIERVKKLIDWLIFEGIIKNRKDLAEKIGYTESSLSQILNQKVPLTDRFIKKFSNINNKINEIWLRTGHGKMLLESEATPTKTHSLVPNHESQSTVISLLPISAQGGSLNDFVVSVKAEDCEKIISPIKGVDFAITVAGDSMSPEYPNGSQILIKKINEKAFIDWGRAYVLDTCNGTVVKKIMPGSDPKKIKCISVNPEYPPFEVNFSDIYGMYRVMMCMAIK